MDERDPAALSDWMGAGYPVSDCPNSSGGTFQFRRLTSFLLFVVVAVAVSLRPSSFVLLLVAAAFFRCLVLLLSRAACVVFVVVLVIISGVVTPLIFSLFSPSGSWATCMYSSC